MAPGHDSRETINAVKLSYNCLEGNVFLVAGTIFTICSTFVTMLVMEKFSDSLEYISSINIHEQKY